MRQSNQRGLVLVPEEFDVDYDEFIDYLNSNDIINFFPETIDDTFKNTREEDEFVGYVKSFVKKIRDARFDYEAERKYASADFFHLLILRPSRRDATHVLFDFMYVLQALYATDEYSRSYSDIIHEESLIDKATAFYLISNQVEINVEDERIIRSMNAAAREYKILREKAIRFYSNGSRQNGRHSSGNGRQRSAGISERGFSGGSSKMKNNNESSGRYGRTLNRLNQREQENSGRVQPRVKERDEYEEPRKTLVPQTKKAIKEVNINPPEIEKETAVQTTRGPSWIKRLELVDKNGLAIVTKNNFHILLFNGIVNHAQLWKPGRNIWVFDTLRMEMRMINPRILELPPEIDSNKIRGFHKSNFMVRKNEDTVPNFNDVLNSSNYNLKVVPNVLGKRHRKDFVSNEPNTILVTEGFLLRGIENNGNPLFENDVLALSAIKTILDSTGENKIFLLEELIHSWYLNDHTTQLKISTKMFWCINSGLTNTFNYILKHYLGLPSIEIGLIINPYKDQREISIFVDSVGKHLGKFYQDIILSDQFFEHLITLTFPALNDKTKLVENEKEFNKNSTDNDLVFYTYPRIGADGTDNDMFDITGFATVESGVEKPTFVISPTETPNLYQLVNDIYRAKKNDFIYPIKIAVGVLNVLTVTKSFVTGEYLGSVSEFEDDMKD